MVGDEAAARRLVGLAVDDPDKTVRRLSLEALESWGQTVKRDPVTGEWRPISPADNAAAKAALAGVAKQLLAADRRDHWATAIRACHGLKVALPSGALQRIVMDPKSPIGAREAAFNQLGGQTPGWAAAVGAKLLARPKQDGRLVKAIHAFLASSDLQGAIPVFSRLTVDDAISIAVRQSAIDALTGSKTPAAHDALRPIFNLWRTGKVPPGLLVELHKAAAVYKEAAPAKEDAVLRLLHGGDADRGRELFVNHQAAQCIRCHRMGRIKGGGDAGPDLSAVAKRLSGRQLVEALIQPGAQIAPGFGIVSVTRKDGTMVAGVLRSETAQYIEIAIGDKPPVRVPVADIASRTKPVSAMPPMGAILKPHEIRDLVAYLATTGRRPPAKKRPAAVRKSLKP
jgi:quinoprotein glucose dehydrogenase